MVSITACFTPLGINTQLAVLVSTLSLAAQPKPKPGHFIDPINPIYSMVLPDGWKQVSPDLARTMRNGMPADLAILLNRGRVDRFGAVDAWQNHGFDGRCLTIHTQHDGEPSLTTETLDQIQTRFIERSQANDLSYVGEPKISTIGHDQHPAIECELHIATQAGQALSTSLVFIVPTGGQTIRFSFRANETDFEAAEPLFRRLAASISLSSPAEGQKELSDKLQTPLIIGAVVGFLMLALYKLNKR